jgi:anti-anti-sigma regulatory factor
MDTSTRVYVLTRDAHTEMDALRNDTDLFSSSEIREVVLDFSGVPLLDSMLVGMLVRIKLQLQARGIALTLKGLDAKARMVLYHSNLGDLLGIALAPPRWDEESAG